MGRTTKAWALLLAAGFLLVGCGSSIPSVRDRQPTQTKAPAGKNDQEFREPKPTSWNRDPDDVPTNIPRAIPQPEPPPEPGELRVKAIANSVTSNPLFALTGGNYRKISISALVSWTPNPQAAQYRVSRSDDGTERFVIRATIPRSFTAFKDGGGFANLAVDNEYRYLIEALDSSGRVIARGQDNVKPLYPLDIPVLTSPSNGSAEKGIQPQFSWDKVAGADGYYIEVFSGTYLVPMWRGYRRDELGTAIKYGEQVDLYPGTMPAVWTHVLTPGAKYTWTVTSYKTDTGNAMTAKAFAKSNAPAWTFTAGAPQTNPEGN